MSRPVTAIRNIGPATEAQFASAGITTAEAVEELGCDAAYKVLIKAGAKPHFMAYVALWMGLHDRPFNSISAEEKAELRSRFDALKQQDGGSGIEADLRALGIRPPD